MMMMIIIIITIAVQTITVQSPARSVNSNTQEQ